MKKIQRTNPATMSKPVGNYSHITRVPQGAEWIVTSGQIGTDVNGEIPGALNDQVTNTFVNLKSILEAEGLTEENVVKVNIWATEELDWDHLDAKWDALFPADYPSMTVAYISALGLPELKIEIELWCAK
ncbi:hypothetical protein JCM19046_1732 [Bacillus sp. JCM 19046]|nr:hypothetical protein JCM19045_310 [Bacillus sp. JCM 19045]GAF17230.1 hypothetical protein JCM19046_1732 [Bacillus sp. JCM 19046]